MRDRVKDEILEKKIFPNQPINKKINFKYSVEEYVQYLERCIDSYNYTSDFRDCLSALSIISSMISTKDISHYRKKQVYEKLKEIRKKMKNLVSQKPKKVSKKNPNYQLLVSMLDEIESLIIAGFYDIEECYQGNSLQLMEYLLFEVKKYDWIQDTLQQFPYMIRLKDKDGKKLIQKIIDHYIEEAFSYTEEYQLKANSSLVYYDRILNLFLKHKKLEFDIEERQEIVKQITNYREQIRLDGYNNLTKRKLVFWLNRLEEQLLNRNHSITFKEICYMHDIKENFDEGVLSEARRLNYEIKLRNYPEHKLIKDEYIITIDDDSARELDDGISIQKLEKGYYRLGVHITDPTSFLPKNSIILDEAIKRTTAIYLQGRVIFLFPEMLAVDKMNLLEGKYRLATSYYLYINESGKIENYEFLETIVSVHNTTYQQVDDILRKGTCKNQELLNTVSLLSEIADKLKNNFQIDQIYNIVNRRESNASQTNITSNTSASKIVETCMMIANYIVPYHMMTHNLPCINRIHEVDQEYLSRLSAIKAKLSSNDEQEVKNAISYLSAFYPKPKYSTEKKGHSGLGLPIYSHVTSPLRRGIDDVIKMYVLDPFYFHPVEDQEAYQIEEKLNEICNYFNERANIIDSFMDYQQSSHKVLTKR